MSGVSAVQHFQVPSLIDLIVVILLCLEGHGSSVRGTVQKWTMFPDFEHLVRHCRYKLSAIDSSRFIKLIAIFFNFQCCHFARGTLSIAAIAASLLPRLIEESCASTASRLVRFQCDVLNPILWDDSLDTRFICETGLS